MSAVDAKKDWNFGLFEAVAEEPVECLIALCIPCHSQASLIVANGDGEYGPHFASACLCNGCGGASIWRRTRVRSKQGIDGDYSLVESLRASLGDFTNFFLDSFVVSCCNACALTQEKLQIEGRKKKQVAPVTAQPAATPAPAAATPAAAPAAPATN